MPWDCVEVDEILETGKQVLEEYVNALVAEKVEEMGLAIVDYHYFEMMYRAKTGLDFPEGMKRTHEGLFLMDCAIFVKNLQEAYFLNELRGGKDLDLYCNSETN